MYKNTKMCTNVQKFVVSKVIYYVLTFLLVYLKINESDGVLRVHISGHSFFCMYFIKIF